MKWSFEAMAAGRFPMRDWRGQPWPEGSLNSRRAGSYLAGGYRAVLIQISGDLDFFSTWMETPRSTAHEKLCALCRTWLHGPRSWKDNRKDSLWQTILLKPSTYRSHWSPKGPLYTKNVLGHGLHALRAPGVDSTFFGSVIHLLVFYILDGGPIQNLHEVGAFNENRQQLNKAKHKYKVRLDKRTMFQPKKGYPKLRGRASDINGLTRAQCMPCGNTTWAPLMRSIVEHVCFSSCTLSSRTWWRPMGLFVATCAFQSRSTRKLFPKDWQWPRFTLNWRSFLKALTKRSLI